MRKKNHSLIINSILLGVSLLIFSLFFLNVSTDQAIAKPPTVCHSQAWDCGDWWFWTNGVQCMITTGTITCTPCGGQDGCGAQQ